MNRSDLLNSGAAIRTVHGGRVLATAGGAGDNTQYNGDWVAIADASFGRARSAKLIIAYDATLTAAQKLTMSVIIQVASDGSGTGAATFVTIPLRDVATVTAKGTVEIDVNLINAPAGFLRAQITPDLTNANTDTAHIAAVWLFGGHPRGPVTKSIV